MDFHADDGFVFHGRPPGIPDDDYTPGEGSVKPSMTLEALIWR
jgi:hypothetical protein